MISASTDIINYTKLQNAFRVIYRYTTTPRIVWSYILLKKMEVACSGLVDVIKREYSRSESGNSQWQSNYQFYRYANHAWWLCWKTKIIYKILDEKILVLLRILLLLRVFLCMLYYINIKYCILCQYDSFKLEKVFSHHVMRKKFLRCVPKNFFKENNYFSNKKLERMRLAPFALSYHGTVKASVANSIQQRWR